MTNIWLITGSSTGFGYEIAKKALSEGHFVVATARKKEALQALVDEFGEKVLPLALDVTNTASITAAKDAALAWKGHIDVLVNNAGIGQVGAVEETSDDIYKKLFAVNVFGLVDVTKAFLPHMREKKNGHILNFSSVAGLLVMPGFGPYCATKHAVEALSETLAAEVAPLGIKVTIVEPGAFRTNFVGGGNLMQSEISDDYKATVAPTRDMLENMKEHAAGDPAKLAAAVVDIAQQEQPPLRLPMGVDAMDWLGPRMDAMKEMLFANEELSRSTNF
ncbi:MAG: oxidoreductase [Candidatus Woesearchaeota archaeon]|nr:oxidoreductase [Candidatus Woesearchaeota archaeon]